MNERTNEKEKERGLVVVAPTPCCWRMTWLVRFTFELYRLRNHSCGLKMERRQRNLTELANQHLPTNHSAVCSDERRRSVAKEQTWKKVRLQRLEKMSRMLWSRPRNIQMKVRKPRYLPGWLKFLSPTSTNLIAERPSLRIFRGSIDAGKYRLLQAKTSWSGSSQILF